MSVATWSAIRSRSTTALEDLLCQDQCNVFQEIVGWHPILDKQHLLMNVECIMIYPIRCYMVYCMYWFGWGEASDEDRVPIYL